jgi:antitoxin (DNA-binding transcriptional repressor) of toxin-antitoxin stability system
MKTITVRDVRQRWPEAERSLAEEGEIVITRDGKPVARLLPVEEELQPRKRFDPEEHRRWMNDFWGEGVMMDSLSGLLADREERVLVSEAALKAMAEEDDQEDRNGEDLKSDSKS